MTRLRLLPLLATTVAISPVACGSGQHVDGSACATITGGMGAEALDRAVACHATVPDAGQCRTSLDQARTMSAESVGTAVACTLRGMDRADGARVGDLLNTLAGDRARLVAAANAFPGAFDTDTHANSFAAAFAGSGQRALGEAMSELSPAATELFVQLALSQGLGELAAYCAPWMRALEPEDPALVSYARSIDPLDTEIDAGERYALTVTGTWNSEDVLDCWQRELGGCSAWEGESPLSLLDSERVQLGSVADPSRALSVLRTRSAELDDVSIRGLVTFIATAEYDNQSNMINSVLNEMTDGSVETRVRSAIASAAVPGMCGFDRVRQYQRRAIQSDPDALSNTETPWVTFIRICGSTAWSPEELMQALSQGSFLWVPDSVRSELRTRLDAVSAASDCAAISALAESAWAMRDVVFPAGLAWVEAANLHGGACADTVRPRVVEVAGDATQHAESRLAAIEWLAAHGDGSACGQIDAALRWSDAELLLDAGPWAQEWATRARSACN